MIRLFLCLGVLLASSARADSLWDAELRLGYGVSVGGSQGMTTTRSSPLTIAAMASYAFEQEPPLSLYGGASFETLDRTSVGAVSGIKLSSGPLRLAAGGAWIFAPATLWGATASIGACKRVAKAVQMCGDVQLAAYFAGTDLPAGAAVTIVQLAMGVVIDAP